MYKLRVHIAPVGFEIDRILLPLKGMKADKVWLLSQRDVKKDLALPFKNKIIEELGNLKIDFKTEECYIDDLFDVLSVLKRIIEKEKRNDIFINVSSGSKIQAIAGMMACMMFGNVTTISPYYVKPEKYHSQPKKLQQTTSGMKDILSLPHYRIEIPEKELIEMLRVIDEAGGLVKKRDLIDKAVKVGLIQVNVRARHIASSRHMSLDKNFIEPLLEWKFIESEGRGRRRVIKLTDNGRNILRVFGQAETEGK